MTIGTLVRRGIVIVAAVAGGIWIVGSFASRNYRSLRMTILVPADAELGKGTAIVAGRATVGTVTQVGEPVWGIPLEVRAAARHPVWIPVVLTPGDSATSGGGPSLLLASLDRSDSVLTFTSGAGETLVLRRDADGGWLGDPGAGLRGPPPPSAGLPRPAWSGANREPPRGGALDLHPPHAEIGRASCRERVFAVV